MDEIRKIREIALIILIGLGSVAVLVAGIFLLMQWQTSERYSYGYSSEMGQGCNVAVVKVFGPIVYYPNESLTGTEDTSTIDQVAAEDVRNQIESADANSTIGAILIQIDSPGGDPVAGEDIAAALRHASKPTVAVIADQGTSAAYWAATGADTIFASANSSLVDIGVTESYLQRTKQNQQNGLDFLPLAAGKYKDMGNPNAPLTDEEKAIIQRDLAIVDQNFIKDVANNRNLSIASVTAVADGSPMLGAVALKNGLIDRTGTIYDAQDYIASLTHQSPVLCE